MSERMAYSLLNDVNLTAPLAVHAKLFVNGKYLGVYSFVQPIDELFTRDHFASDKNKGKGALYKEVWFNSYGMQKLRTNRKGGSPQDDDWMRNIMSEITRTPLTAQAATSLFTKYFDMESFVDVIALDTAIADSDDWRQRHNFFWYVRDDGLTGKKLVFLPWDYDRLYDEAALTKGPLKGHPWWDIIDTASISICNKPPVPPAVLAQQTAKTPADVARWTDIYGSLAPDFQTPITCDKITQLLSLAYGAKVRSRTRDFLKLITVPKIRNWFAIWNAQIELALSYDPDGPNSSKLQSEQQQLLAHLDDARTIALTQAQSGDMNEGSITTQGTSLFGSPSSPFTSPFATGGAFRSFP